MKVAKYILSKQELLKQIKFILTIINKHPTDIWEHEIVSYEEIVSISRRRTFYYPKMICCYLLRNHDFYYVTQQSLSDVFAIKAHASIINSLKSCQNLIDSSRVFANYYKAIKEEYCTIIKTGNSNIDITTHENLIVLCKLGYFYNSDYDKFWSAEHGVFVSIPLEWCSDIVKLFNHILAFEKAKAVDKMLKQKE